jgi:predicted transcriptional regulator
MNSIHITLKNSLISIGCTPLDADVFVQLFIYKHSVTEISRELSTNRPKIYLSLKYLLSLGLVRYVDKKWIRVSPKVIFTRIQNQKYNLDRSVQDYKDILPTLVENYFEVKKKPAIQIFDGENKFLYLFHTLLDEIEEGQDMISFNEGDDLYKWFYLDYFVDVWIEKRVAKKITNRILYNSRNRFIPLEKDRDSAKLRNTKILPENYRNMGSFWVIGTERVILWDTVTPKAIVIDNSILANLLKTNFDIIWGL